MKIINRISSLFGASAVAEKQGPRILAYCASNIGMGHYCRLLRVLEEAKRLVPDVSILLATDARDSAMSARLGVALLQLPRFRFTDHEKFKEEPELLNIQARELKEIRSSLLLSLGSSYKPHVVLMDTNPHGKRDEVLPLLRHLRRAGSSRSLIMMRDIPSPPGESFKLAGEESAIRKHASLYDRMLFAGDQGFFDIARAYGWPEDVREKMSYVGFVVPEVSRGGAMTREAAFAAYPQLDPATPTVVVSFGGGWQADLYAEPIVEGLRLFREIHRKPAQMVLALGPALGHDSFRALKGRAEALGGIVVEHFSPHFSQVLAHCDLAVLQAGSVPFQILESDIPILLTHRPYKSREQEERAKRLARWPGVRLVQQEQIAPAECAEWLHWGLAGARVRRSTGYSFDGIANAAREVVRALQYHYDD